jgi:hypothetical protein
MQDGPRGKTGRRFKQSRICAAKDVPKVTVGLMAVGLMAVYGATLITRQNPPSTLILAQRDFDSERVGAGPASNRYNVRFGPLNSTG